MNFRFVVFFLLRLLILFRSFFHLASSIGATGSIVHSNRFYVLQIEKFKHYIDTFNADDEELYSQYFTNADAWLFLSQNIPFFECPDKDMERAYYFRWWTYRKHIHYVTSPLTSKSFFVITEFLPHVPWAGVFNTISCAAGHHIREGRWLVNGTFLDDYSRFWLREGNPTQYSFWIAESIRARSLVTGSFSLAVELYSTLVANFEKLRLTNTVGASGGVQPKDVTAVPGLYFNTDNRDGMEFSIGSKESLRAYRPTLNSYQYGEATALRKLSLLVNNTAAAAKFAAIAHELKELLQTVLWDNTAMFFKALPYRKAKIQLSRDASGASDPCGHHRAVDTDAQDNPGPDTAALGNGYQSLLVKVRELHGYTPWYFNIPSDDKLVAWDKLMDPSGFYAPHGLTTAERCHPKFEIDYLGKHECLWNGPSWPYATSITLTALSNVLNTKEKLAAPFVDKDVFFNLTRTYALAHRRTLPDPPLPAAAPTATPLAVSGSLLHDELRLFHSDTVDTPPSSSTTTTALPQESATAAAESKVVSWIDENIHPLTGDWISRTILRRWGWPAVKGGRERGKDYNHSTFVDIIIIGIIGLRPRPSDDLLVINPLIPADDVWDYFCMDGLQYHGATITVMWDRFGGRYGRGAGLHVMVNGETAGFSQHIRKLKIKLSQFMK